MSITICIEMVLDMRIMIEYLILWKAINSIPHAVFESKNLVVVSRVFINAEVAHRTERFPALEQLSRNETLQHTSVSVHTV